MEKKNQFILFRTLSICECEVIFADDGAPMLYRYLDEEGEDVWCNFDELIAFDFEADAVSYRNDLIEELESQFTKVRKFLSYMIHISEENEFLPHKKEEYLGHYKPLIDYDECTIWRKNYLSANFTLERVSATARTGIFSVKGINFRLSDIKSVKYHKSEGKKTVHVNYNDRIMIIDGKEDIKYVECLFPNIG